MSKSNREGHSEKLNAEFFADNEKYAERVAALPTYRNIRRFIDRQVRGVHRLVDIGNGGVFDYDTSIVDNVSAVDLFKETTQSLPANVSFCQGDARELPFPDEHFDGALMSLVCHHLTGRQARDMIVNVECAIREAYRVLVPGGKLVVVESCVPSWFYGPERLAYPILGGLTRTRLVKHPPALQVPVGLLRDLVAARFGAFVECEPIPVGALVLQFGHRWPTWLTPARPFGLTAMKASVPVGS